MAFDGINWTDGVVPTLAKRIAAAERTAAAAERAWRGTFAAEEDPDGAAPPVSSHPDRAESQEAFRRAHAALLALRDGAEEEPATSPAP